MTQSGAATRPMPGQVVSGDTWFYHETPTHCLAVVIDGLGHGPGAYEAAQRAYNAIKDRPEQPLTALMTAAHIAAQGSRGVVAGLLRLNLTEHTLNYVGVGNIGIYVVSERSIKPISRNGTVGYRLPSLFEQHATYNEGDLFVLFSDGISMRFADAPWMRAGLEPQTLADRILMEFSKVSDDATVLVVRA